MTSPQDTITDLWSFLDHKPRYSKITRPFVHNSWILAPWIGKDSVRRLTAYALYEDYYKNNGRKWLDEADEETVAARREYGDSYITVETILASLLGEDISLVYADDATDKFKEFFGTWWTEQEGVDLKVASCERKSVKYGDGVYVFREDDELGRPTVEVWDPGFYFPQLDPTQPNQQYPLKVYIAFEYTEDDKTYITRETWELVPLVDGVDNETSVPREPWNGDNSRPRTMTCLHSVHTWLLDEVKWPSNLPPHPSRLPMNQMIAELSDAPGDEEDLGIDWLPVLHVPNTYEEDEHFGQSCLSPGIQIFDDIANADTDLEASASTTGSPPLMVSGSGEGDVETYGPGSIIRTGEGTGTMIDTSTSLVALSGWKRDLHSQMSIIERIPESLLGLVKPSEVPSGITLTISFAPHSSMVKGMRKVRTPKYNLFTKFVGRLALKMGLIDQMSKVEVVFGPFMPADKKEAADLITSLRGTDPPIISLETAVKMAISAGYPIEDVEAEIKLIMSRDYDSADKAFTATGDVNVARDLLGLPKVAAPTAPPPQPPGPGPTPPPNPAPQPPAGG